MSEFRRTSHNCTSESLLNLCRYCHNRLRFGPVSMDWGRYSHLLNRKLLPYRPAFDSVDGYLCCARLPTLAISLRLRKKPGNT